MFPPLPLEYGAGATRALHNRIRENITNHILEKNKGGPEFINVGAPMRDIRVEVGPDRDGSLSSLAMEPMALGIESVQRGHCTIGWGRMLRISN